MSRWNSLRKYFFSTPVFKFYAFQALLKGKRLRSRRQMLAESRLAQAEICETRTLLAGIIVDSGGGADFTTIQAAVNSAAAGDVITVNDGTYNETVNLNLMGSAIAGSPGDLVIQASNSRQAFWNDAGAALTANGISGSFTIQGFDMGTATVTNVSGLVTFNDNQFDALNGVSGITANVTGTTDMGVHVIDSDFSSAGFNLLGAISAQMGTSAGGTLDLVVDQNNFTGLQQDGISVNNQDQTALGAGTLTARITDNIFSGRTSLGDEIGMFLGGNNSNGFFASVLIDGNQTNIGSTPSSFNDAISLDVDGTNTTAYVAITNNNLNHHNDGMFLDADSTFISGLYNVLIDGNTLDNIEEEGIHLRPFSDVAGDPAVWNVLITGNTLTDINSDLSTGHGGIEIEVDNDSNDEYTLNIDLNGNNVSMASTSPNSSYVIDANSTGTNDAIANIERDIATNNTGSVTIDDPQTIVTMPSANAVTNSNEVRTISGFVFNDSNGDGSQSGEAGVGGVLVTLTGTQAIGGTVSLSTFTDINGNFAFPSVIQPNGSGYTLTVGTTSAFGFYTLQDSVGDALDSDVDQTNGQFNVSFVGSGADIDVDAGLSATAVISIPTTLLVDIATDENDGNYSAGDLSLREAILLANMNADANTITFDASLNNATIDLTLGELEISSELSIVGLGADLLTIDAGNNSRVFFISDGDNGNDIDVSISGLTISGGQSLNTDLTENAGRGAGIHSYENLTITSSNITGNTADSDGGGIWIRYGDLTVLNSTISGNTAKFHGGGIYSRSNQVEISNSTISGNVLTAGNSGVSGGGVYGTGNTVAISYSTITGNSARRGGGVYGADTLSHTIVAGNSANVAPDVHGNIVAYFSLIGDTTDMTITSGSDNISNVDARLDVLADNGGRVHTHALLFDSPALGAGDETLVASMGDVPEFDQRGTGFDRIIGDAIDIGAFEVQGDITPPTLASADIVDDQSGGPIVEGTMVTYTITFSEDIDENTVDAADFDNAGTAPITIGTITETSPGVFTVEVTPTGPGSLILCVPNGATIDDASGNSLVAPVQDDTTLTVVTGLPIRINEVDADTSGSPDDLEFIELYDGGTGNTLLTGLVVVLFNGSDDQSYQAFDLDGQTTDANGYFVLGNAGVNNVGLIFANDTMQNGADAVALFVGDAADFPNDTPVTTTNLIDAVVYDTDDADDTGLIDVLTPGQAQINENQNGNKDAHAIARLPDGGTALNTSTYVVQTPTPGVSNIPATLLVDTATDENDGDFSAGDLSLREAIILANSNADANTITFDAALNGTDIVLTLSGAGDELGDLDITTEITIIGNGADQTVIDGGGSGGLDYRIFDVSSSSNFTLSGVTVTGGNSGFGHGAGIRVQSGVTAEIHSSVISNNTSSGNFGGGVSNGGTLSITDSTISGNTGFGGGGIWNDRGGSLTVSNSTFSGNLAHTYGGGGIYNGGMANATVVNSTITGNTSSGALDDGGGIADYGTFTLNNTIVAGNSAAGNPDIIGTIDTASNNLIGDADSSGGLTDGTNGNIVGMDGVGVRDINTILNTTLADNGGPTLTHALVTGSVTLEAGDNSLAVDTDSNPLTTDQRGSGFDRISNSIVDIGAFELQIIDDPSLDGTAGDDAFTVSLDGTDIVVTLNSAEVFRQALSLTDSLTLNGLAGDDTFNVNHSSGVVDLPIVVAGGTQTSTPGDVLNISGGTFTDVTYDFTNANNGTIDYDGTLITYTGLEPIIDTSTATNRTFEFNGSAEIVTLSDDTDADDGESFIDSTLGESVVFTNPTGTLRVDLSTGSGADTLNVEGLDSSFDANLTIVGDSDVGEEDFVNFQTNALDLDSGNLSVDVGAGNPSSSINSITVAANLTTTGNLAFETEVAIGADVTFTGADITFNSNVFDDADSAVRAVEFVATGTATFADEIGQGGRAFGDFDVTATTIILGSDSGNSVNIIVDDDSNFDGTITFDGNLVLYDDVAFDLADNDLTPKNLTITGTINADAAASNRRFFVSTHFGLIEFGSSIGDTEALADFGVNDSSSTNNTPPTIVLGGDISVTQANGIDSSVDLEGNVLLDDDVTINIADKRLSVLGSINAYTGAAGTALVINSTGSTQIEGAIGDTNTMTDFITTLTTNAGGTWGIQGNVTTTGNQSFGDDITLAANITLTSGEDITFNSNVVLDENSELDGVDIDFLAGVSGDSNLTLTSTGTVTFAAMTTSDFTGNLTVTSGTLQVLGEITDTTATVTIEDGATLAGTGSVLAMISVEEGGTVAPGLSPGQLDTGDVEFNTGAIFEVELNGAVAGVDYDQLIVNGSIDLDADSMGGAILALSTNLKYVPQQDDEFIVIDVVNAGSSVTGTFSGLAEGDTMTVDGIVFRISYQGGTGNDVTLTAVNTPPTVELTNTITSLPDNTDTSSRIKVADIVVADDRISSFQTGMFHENNILIMNDPSGPATLFEFDTSGNLVSTTMDITEGRDLVFDSNGILHVFQGTSLFSYNPVTCEVTETFYPGLSTVGNLTYGAITAYGDYLFIADMQTANEGAPSGVVRVNINDLSDYERFNIGSPIDINVGLDGFLYTFTRGNATGADGTRVTKYDPETMLSMGSIDLFYVARAIAIDADGNIFAAHHEILRQHDPAGNIINELAVPGFGGEADLDISKDGSTLLFTSHGGEFIVFDHAMTSFSRYNSQPSNNVAFGTFVQTPVGSDTGNQLSLTGADADLFEIIGSELYLKAGVTLQFETNPALDVTVQVDDTAVGMTPDDTASLTISLTDAVPSTRIDISPSSLGYGIPGQDNAKGEGYILYSYLSVQERFAGAVIANGAEHFLAVRFINNQWQYANNDVWVDFTPTTGDRLIAAINFESGQVQMLQGSSGTVNGIDQGYIVSDLMITPNQWRNTYNAGEFGITGTFFTLEQIPPPRPNQVDIAPASLGYGIPGQDNAKGEGYILYSYLNVQERFTGAVIENGAENFLVVRFINNQWQYAHNDVWVDFTPTTGDRLIATIDFDSSQVQMLQGSSGTVNGIDQGYVESDLMITPNQWRNTYNEGEFGITGTYFTLEQAPPRPNQINIAPTSLGYGIPGQDNANGEGYVLYSQQNVQERFAGAIIANGAEHFLAVRFINNQWQYAHNDVWVDFTPTTGDRLIAAINFSSSQVQMLQGSSGTVNGIDQGYVESDLMITP
ncbi:MAG: hypothetical protein CMN21_04195, partial [Rubinisphaera sp.]|uniref:beta strand repeat-containing protein n=1 Tax=Rubinisphaera sp. TaxID=2024857 RepID=UPI000C11A83B